MTFGSGFAISNEDRDALLAKCAAGEHVRLVIEVLAYEHKLGTPNRRFVRIVDGAVQAAATSAEGRPFIRDHEQANSLARGGTILESRAVRRGPNDYAIMMSVELTAPWAVELALRGLLTTVSIGMNPTGPVLCSHCGTEILTDCYHLPGEEIATKAGTVVCEWLFTAVEIVELSAVNVPAVPGAHIEGIRAALSAALDRRAPDADLDSASVLASIERTIAMVASVKLLEADLSSARAEISSIRAECDSLRSAQFATDAKAFIDEAIELGKIAPREVEVWSTLYAHDPRWTIENMSKRRPGVFWERRQTTCL